MKRAPVYVAQSDRPMPKARRRRIEALSADVDRVLETDRRFFDRHHDRQFRVRLAARAEVDLNRVLTGEGVPLPPALRHFVAVKQMAPGARTRVFLIGTADASTDVPEKTAQAIFENTFRQTGHVIDDEGGAL